MVRTLLCVACLCWSIEGQSLAQDAVQTDSAHYRVVFQDDQVRVLRLTLGPHESGAVREHPNGVLVFLTADLQGHMPPAEVQWQPAGPRQPEENVTNTSFEAILVEFLQLPAGQSPTLTILSEWSGPLYPVDRPKITSLIDNEWVSVRKERFPGTTRDDNIVVFPADTVFVYLNGGDLAGTSTGGAIRARRGEVDVLPAHTLHRVENLGFDPVELIIIQPK